MSNTTLNFRTYTLNLCWFCSSYFRNCVIAKKKFFCKTFFNFLLTSTIDFDSRKNSTIFFVMIWFKFSWKRINFFFFKISSKCFCISYWNIHETNDEAILIENSFDKKIRMIDAIAKFFFCVIWLIDTIAKIPFCVVDVEKFFLTSMFVFARVKIMISSRFYYESYFFEIGQYVKIFAIQREINFKRDTILINWSIIFFIKNYFTII